MTVLTEWHRKDDAGRRTQAKWDFPSPHQRAMGSLPFLTHLLLITQYVRQRNDHHIRYCTYSKVTCKKIEIITRYEHLVLHKVATVNKSKTKQNKIKEKSTRWIIIKEKKKHYWYVWWCECICGYCAFFPIESKKCRDVCERLRREILGIFLRTHM